MTGMLRFNFCRTKNALNSLCAYFNDFVKRTGEKIVHPASEEGDEAMVQELLDFKDLMDGLISNCFDVGMTWDVKHENLLRLVPDRAQWVDAGS